MNSNKKSPETREISRTSCCIWLCYIWIFLDSVDVEHPINQMNYLRFVMEWRFNIILTKNFDDRNHGIVLNDAYHLPTIVSKSLFYVMF